MSHSNTTPNWGIPQFTSNDVPSWLGDVNQIGRKVEQGLDAVKIIGQDANTAASGAQATANALTPRVAANEQGIEGLQTVVGGHTLEVDELKQDVLELDGRVVALESLESNWTEHNLTWSGSATTNDSKVYINKDLNLVCIKFDFVSSGGISGGTVTFTDKLFATPTPAITIAKISQRTTVSEATTLVLFDVNITNGLIGFSSILGTKLTDGSIAEPNTLPSVVCKQFITIHLPTQYFL